MLPGTLRPHGAAARTQHLDIEVMIMEVGIKQRNIQILPLARPIAIKQSARYRSERMYTRRNVANSQHRRIMRSAFFTAQPCHPSICLADVIVTRVICQGSILTESRYRAHDNVWI